MSKIKIGGIGGLVAEGATYVWGDALRGVHEQHDVAILALDSSRHRDGEIQNTRQNRAWVSLGSAGLRLACLDRHSTNETFNNYTAEDLTQTNSFVADKDIIACLEEPPLVLLQKIRRDAILAPVIPNLYRSGAYKTADEIDRLRYAFASGLAQHATVDAFASQIAYARRGIPTDKMTVIPNGIDTSVFKPSPERRTAIRNSLQIENDDPTILLVARYSEEKNVSLFLQSARIYLEQVPNAHVIMTGTGLDISNEEMRALVEIYFDNTGNTNKKRLHMLGNRSDIPALYNASDVLALTSSSESRPLCISEAYASGIKVVVSTNVGDTSKMIGNHGYIITGDPREKSPTRINDMAKEIAKRWQEAYDNQDEIGYQIECRQELGVQPMIDEYTRIFERFAT